MDTDRYLPPKQGSDLTQSLRLTQELGHGNEAVVWKAQDKDTKKYHAVKILREQSKGNPDSLNQFRRTFHVVKERLGQHPNICRLEEFVDQSQYGPWFRMEFVGHVCLMQYLRTRKDSGRPLSPLQLCDLLKPIAKALDFSHTNNILHSDIKQDHLMVDLSSQGEASLKLIDFGEALILDQWSPDSDSSAWPSSGTKGYISPERQRGETQTGRSDQYSFAVVVHELLLGYKPTQIKSTPDPSDAAVCSIGFRRPELIAALRRGLAPDPAQRFKTCCDFLEAVRIAADGDQPVSGSLLGESFVGLQRQKSNLVSQPLSFWEQPDFEPAIGHKDRRKDSEELEKQVNNLSQEYQRLLQELDRLEIEPVKVGIVGTRNAGKSSLFAVWYLVRSSLKDAVDLVIDDDDTKGYLKAISAELLQQGGLRANPYGNPPQYLRMKVTVHDRTWPLVTCDFAGEFLNSETNRESEEAAETLKFLREADMVIFLYDPDPDPKRIDWKIRDHIDHLFREKPRELVLALTKIDEHWAARDEFGSARFAQIYDELREANPVLDIVATKLHHSFCPGGLKIIPISSFGGKLPEGTKSGSGAQHSLIEQLKPFQVFSPLAAAFQRRADDVKHLQYRLEQLRRKVGRFTKLLDKARTDAKGIQAKIDPVVDEVKLAGGEIDAAVKDPNESAIEILKTYERTLPDKFRKLEKLYAGPELQKYQPILERVRWAITNFPRLKDEYETKNLLKCLTDNNKRSVIVFVLLWLKTSHASWSLDKKVDAGVPDDVRVKFNEQYDIYLYRSARIAVTMIAGFVLLFLFLLTR